MRKGQKLVPIQNLHSGNNQKKIVPQTQSKSRIVIRAQQQKNEKLQKPFSNIKDQKSVQQQQKSQQQPILGQIKQKAQYDQQNNYPIAVLLGTPGVGKTQIMHKLFPNEKQLKEFTLYKLEDLKYNFVDTTGFDFEGEIDWREVQIKNYQNLFLKFSNQISSLFVVVNFERTDLMKKKLLSVYKYFRKFKNLMSIVVTDFHLSESNRDKEHLKKNFQIFQPNDILFVRGDVKSEELKESLKKSKMLNKLIESNQFNLKDTIFELQDMEEYNNIRKDLLKMINK
ncbi:unnamed protein product [Paramecium primaurelia]|uniref:P-loop containing nucleoside triphosphate hydrolase n=1 Tax=Paramecium primaurelia TaxID=5886 RepID=A0A8S1PRA5_PARPR|nr:unnamed protein product [Paramecium primaurelia]